MSKRQGISKPIREIESWSLKKRTRMTEDDLVDMSGKGHEGFRLTIEIV